MYFLKRVVHLKFANKKSLKAFIYQRFSDFCLMELVTGIGPVTPTLPRWCSTAEPHQHFEMYSLWSNAFTFYADAKHGLEQIAN